jgi:hypothetical protein
MVRNFEDAQNLGKDNLDATLMVFGVVSKGYQAIALEAVDYAKKAFEDGNAAAEKLLAAKSLDKAMEVQNDYLRSAYQGFVSQANRVGQLYADLVQEACKPFESHWAKATSAK